MNSELQVLIPDRTFNTSAGKVSLVPFKFKHFNRALEIIERYVNVFMVSQTAEEIANRLFAKVSESYEVLNDINTILGMVIVPSAAAIEIDELRYDEVLGIVVEVVDMNLVFFKQIGERLNEKDKSEQAPA
jgi:hypothetical protein